MKQLEITYRNMDDRAKKFQQVIPLVNLLKDFWSVFKEATVSGNGIDEGDGLLDLPIDSDSIERLREMVDIFVESFTIDHENKITVQLSVPILEQIEADANRCRQLTNIPSP